MRTATLLLTAAAILIGDQVTKALVVANVALGQRVSVLGNLLQVWHAQNRGASFSLFQGGGLIFVAVSILAVGMVAYFHQTMRDRGWWIHLVLGVILGGTLGNLADRLRQGYVVDWASVGIGDLRWPTFNVADSSLVVGIGVLLIYLLLTDPGRRQAPA